MLYADKIMPTTTTGIESNGAGLFYDLDKSLEMGGAESTISLSSVLNKQDNTDAISIDLDDDEEKRGENTLSVIVLKKFPYV